MKTLTFHLLFYIVLLLLIHVLSESSQFVRFLGDSAELTVVSEHFRQQNRVKWQ